MKTNVNYITLMLSHRMQNEDDMNSIISRIIGGTAIPYEWVEPKILPISQLFKSNPIDRYYTIMEFIDDLNYSKDHYQERRMYLNYLSISELELLKNISAEIFLAHRITKFLVLHINLSFVSTPRLPKTITNTYEGIKDIKEYTTRDTTTEYIVNDTNSIYVTYRHLKPNIADTKIMIYNWLEENIGEGDQAAILIQDIDSTIIADACTRKELLKDITAKGHMCINYNTCVLGGDLNLPYDRGYCLNLN